MDLVAFIIPFMLIFVSYFYIWFYMWKSRKFFKSHGTRYILYGIFYANFLAHRDPDVFEKPEDFIPERWNGSNAGDEDKIFGFGSGPHRCIGENLMRDVMQFVGKVFRNLKSLGLF